jgi:hypothetical protein
VPPFCLDHRARCTENLRRVALDSATLVHQVVHIKAKESLGRAPRWGTGSFALAGGAALTLEGVEVSGQITVPSTTSGRHADAGGLLAKRYHRRHRHRRPRRRGRRGLPGTFVLRLAGVGPFELPALDVHADQDVHITCVHIGGLAFLPPVTIGAVSALTVSGEATLTLPTSTTL